MKWIGQHIVDLIARFRSSIYLENLADPGLDTDKFLVADSDGKIGYRTGAEVASDIGVSGTFVDLTSEVSGVLPVGNGGTGAATLGSTEILLGNGSSAITSGSDLTYSGEILSVGTHDDGIAEVVRKNSTGADTNGGQFRIRGARGTGTNKVGGELSLVGGPGTGNGAAGAIKFYGWTAGSSGTSPQASILEIAAFDASGNLQIDGGLTTGSTSVINNSGVIQVATQGTIDHDSLANFVAAEHYRWDTDISATATINAANIPTLNQDTTGTAAEAVTLTAGDKSINGTFQSKGLIVDGNYSVTAGGDGVGLHLDAQDITDSSTSASGTAALYNHVVFENPRILATNSSVTTTDASTVYIKGAPSASTNQTITNAYSLYVKEGGSYFGGDLTVNGDSVTFESANADDPIFTLKNTSNDSSNATQMIFVKDRGVAPAVGTNLGEVRFVGEDSGQNSQEYGGFLCEIDVATNGQESGQFGIWVATHDGELQYGLQLTGGSEEDEVDVSIGQGAASLTTVAGNLSVTGQLTCSSRTLDQTTGSGGATVGDHDGDVVYFGNTTSMTIGKMYLYTDSANSWVLTNADAVATSDGLLAVALGAASDTNGMLLRGFVTLDHDPGAIGDVLYIQSDNAGTPGNATATAPSASGDCVRVIGYQVNHASSGNIWFNPDNTFVEIA